MQFLIKLVKIIQSLSNEEFNHAKESPRYLVGNYPNLQNEWHIHLEELSKKRRESDSYWNKTVREIRYWEDQEVDYMYQRIMALSRSILQKQYFEVQTHSGGATVPDKTTILNRLVKLSSILLTNIYPSILRLVHYKTDIIDIYTSSIRGHIDWNKTILNAARTSAGRPIFFVCNTPKRSFSTPENVLLYMAIAWIFTDAVNLYTSQGTNIVSSEDKEKNPDDFKS